MRDTIDVIKKTTSSRLRNENKVKFKRFYTIHVRATVVIVQTVIIITQFHKNIQYDDRQSYFMINVAFYMRLQIIYD